MSLPLERSRYQHQQQPNQRQHQERRQQERQKRQRLPRCQMSTGQLLRDGGGDDDGGVEYRVPQDCLRDSVSGEKGGRDSYQRPCYWPRQHQQQLLLLQQQHLQRQQLQWQQRKFWERTRIADVSESTRGHCRRREMTSLSGGDASTSAAGRAQCATSSAGLRFSTALSVASRFRPSRAGAAIGMEPTGRHTSATATAAAEGPPIMAATVLSNTSYESRSPSWPAGVDSGLGASPSLRVSSRESLVDAVWRTPIDCRPGGGVSGASCCSLHQIGVSGSASQGTARSASLDASPLDLLKAFDSLRSPSRRRRELKRRLRKWLQLSLPRCLRPAVRGERGTVIANAVFYWYQPPSPAVKRFPLLKLDDPNGGPSGGAGSGSGGGSSAILSPTTRQPKAPLGVNVNRSTGQQTISVLKVYLNNGEFRSVKCGDATDVRGIIHLLCYQLHPSVLPLEAVFALRLRHVATGDLQWLHRDTTLHQVLDKYLPRNSLNDWRFELRVRYLLADLDEFLQRDRVTFAFFYEQVKNDYLKAHDDVCMDLAITLCCLEIRRFYKDVSQLSIDKKSTALEFLEREVGLDRFLPAGILLQNKAKVLRKLILAQFKNVAKLSETQCMLQFLRSVKQIIPYEREVFPCQLGTGWTVSVELIISCEQGIGFATDARSGVLRSVGQFAHVQNIETVVQEGDSRALLRLRVAGASEPLSVSCDSLRTAEAIADLVDGYCRLVHAANHSYWTRKDNHPPRYRRSASKGRCGARSGEAVGEGKLRYSEDYAEIVDDEGDYSSTTRDLELDRATLSLGEVIGQGQFGAVHRGEWRAKDGSCVPVAIKTCNGHRARGEQKAEKDKNVVGSEESDGADKLLDEAHTMKQLDHPHIIRLVGTCSSTPVWIVMELARYGELRAFLQRNRDRIRLLRQLLWARQLASALCYIQQKGLVHRDVAARNVLVASKDCVKLADFGLSRELGHAAEYTASRGKLPIKWMAPESINFRRFTSASDVWMFAVCVWEILSLGVKPFQGVKNNEVVARLEDGERLPLPAGCPPRLYSILSLCWSYEPSKRPHFSALKESLLDIYNEELIQEEAMRRDTRKNHAMSWGSDGSDCSDEPPPKPARPVSELRNSVCSTPTPAVSRSSLLGSSNTAVPSLLAPATYIVAETPEVLAELMRDNDGALPPAWAYVAPASPTNTFTVGLDNQANITENSMSSLVGCGASAGCAGLSEPTGRTTGVASLSSTSGNSFAPPCAGSLVPGNVLQQAAQQQRLSACSSPTNASQCSMTAVSGLQAFAAGRGVPECHGVQHLQDDTPPPPAPKTPPRSSSGSSGFGGSVSLTDDRELLERRLLEIKLKEQQREVERDQRWLNEQSRFASSANCLRQNRPECMTRPGALALSDHVFRNSASNSVSRQHSLTQQTQPVDAASSTAPMRFRNEGDPFYVATTGVVRSVMRLSEGVRAHQVDAYLELVRNTGEELRVLLAAVDNLQVGPLGDAAMRDGRVGTAQQRISADMAALVSAVKLAVQLPNDSEQRRAMLEAAHLLAVDSKSLLDVVDDRRATEAAVVVTSSSVVPTPAIQHQAAPSGLPVNPAASALTTVSPHASRVVSPISTASPGNCARGGNLPVSTSAVTGLGKPAAGNHSRAGSNVGDESADGALLRFSKPETSSSRSMTPTSLRSESFPRSSSSTSTCQTEGQSSSSAVERCGLTSVRFGASTPGLGRGLQRGGARHIESTGSLPRSGTSTPVNTFSGFSSLGGHSYGGSLPRAAVREGLVASIIDAINNGKPSPLLPTACLADIEVVASSGHSKSNSNLSQSSGPFSCTAPANFSKKGDASLGQNWRLTPKQSSASSLSKVLSAEAPGSTQANFIAAGFHSHSRDGKARKISVNSGDEKAAFSSLRSHPSPSASKGKLANEKFRLPAHASSSGIYDNP